MTFPLRVFRVVARERCAGAGEPTYVTSVVTSAPALPSDESDLFLLRTESIESEMQKLFFRKVDESCNSEKNQRLKFLLRTFYLFLQQK